MTDLIFQFSNWYLYQTNEIIGGPADLLSRMPSKEYFNSAFMTSASRKGATCSVPINNPEKAFMTGIEIGWQTHMWYLPGVLSGLVLDLNASIINSHTLYPYFTPVQKGLTTTLVYTTKPGRVPDQPSQIYNAILGWDYKGFSSRISVRHQKQTLNGLDTRYAWRDAYYDDVTLVDISLKQQLLYNIAVYANFTNITNHVDNYYINPPVGSIPQREETYGMIAQFGISYNY
jgi:outer membrane receptor protein involved in Fe transport